jgi:hypothetical protein
LLDVHAPDHRIGGKRDFFIHLFTITIGLLIALALENAAEALHHRHERMEAEESIREELSNNREKLRKGAAVLKKETENIAHALVLLQQAQQSKQLTGQIDLEFRDETLDDGAWRTATGTGVLAYMSYAEVERFADAYKEQGLLEEAQHKAIEDYLELTPILLSKKDLSPQDAAAALPIAQRAIGHLSGVLAFGQGTMNAYNDALQ